MSSYFWLKGSSFSYLLVGRYLGLLIGMHWRLTEVSDISPPLLEVSPGDGDSGSSTGAVAGGTGAGAGGCFSWFSVMPASWVTFWKYWSQVLVAGM